MSSILNSKKLDDLIKPLQAKGQFGERHIHKIPFLFPIAQYKPDVKEHRELAMIGLDCHEKVKKLIPSLTITSVGSMRSKIRETLKSEFSLIEKNVDAILTTKIQNSGKFPERQISL